MRILPRGVARRRNLDQPGTVVQVPCEVLKVLRHVGAEPSIPASLDELVALALARHPEAAALELDADSARARTTAAGRPMDAQWMLGAEALGAMPDSPDPTMLMFGIEQMISLPAVYRASRDRAFLDVRWAEGERARIAADVEEFLWGTAARLRAQTAQLVALDQQIAAAEAALAYGRARYSSGGRSDTRTPETTGSPPPPATPQTPRVNATKRGAVGMGGMGGMGGSPGGRVGADSMPEGPGMAEMGGGMAAGMTGPMGGGTGADLVAVWQTQVGVLRDATDAELAVELARARLARLEGT